DRSPGAGEAGGASPEKEGALVRALVEAVEAVAPPHPGWAPAEMSLAQWYLAHDQAAKAIDLLSGIARRRGTAAAYAALAEAELAHSRQPEGPRRGRDHLQTALRLDPGNADLWMRFGSAL